MIKLITLISATFFSMQSFSVTVEPISKDTVIYTGLHFKPKITVKEFEENKKNAKSCTKIKNMEHEKNNTSLSAEDCIEWYDPNYFAE